jgi:hypothetical protein
MWARFQNSYARERICCQGLGKRTSELISSIIGQLFDDMRIREQQRNFGLVGDEYPASLLRPERYCFSRVLVPWSS